MMIYQTVELIERYFCVAICEIKYPKRCEVKFTPSLDNN